MPGETHHPVLPEPPNVDARRLVWFAGAALLLLGGAIFGLGAIFQREVPINTIPPPRALPQPRVQPNEANELQRILSQQRRRLTGYRWANQEHTLVEIPIERAMKIIAERGARAYDPIAPSPAALSSPEAGAERAITPSATQAGKPSNGPSSNGTAGGSP